MRDPNRIAWTPEEDADLEDALTGLVPDPRAVPGTPPVPNPFTPAAPTPPTPTPTPTPTEPNPAK